MRYFARARYGLNALAGVVFVELGVLAEPEEARSDTLLIVAGLIGIAVGLVMVWRPPRPVPLPRVSRANQVVGFLGLGGLFFPLGYFTVNPMYGPVADRMATMTLVVLAAAWGVVLALDNWTRPLKPKQPRMVWGLRGPSVKLATEGFSAPHDEGVRFSVSWDAVEFDGVRMPLVSVSNVIEVQVAQEREVALYPGTRVVRVPAGPAVRLDFGSTTEVSERLGRQWFFPTAEGARVVAAVWERKRAYWS